VLSQERRFSSTIGGNESMSKKEDFHPSLSTLDVAKFQLLEQGFAGIVNGVTLVPAKDVRTIEANHIRKQIIEFLEKTDEGENILDYTGEVMNLIVTCKVFLEQYSENPEVAVLVVYKPSVKEGVDNVQPIARIIDPWEVIEPEFAHTDGAGNVKEPNGGAENNSNNPSRSKGNGSAH